MFSAFVRRMKIRDSCVLDSVQRNVLNTLKHMLKLAVLWWGDSVTRRKLAMSHLQRYISFIFSNQRGILWISALATRWRTRPLESHRPHLEAHREALTYKHCTLKERLIPQWRSSYSANTIEVSSTRSLAELVSRVWSIYNPDSKKVGMLCKV